ncbi:unnamed protein product [Mytilus edulis]|uniref:Uncharacterized protein n=1 Tax=Mytilus edulis TaxID=6550 RepID=A0A8S3QE00_MYTED|nr:unnamed protein product [Mytilus edulis]
MKRPIKKLLLLWYIQQALQLPSVTSKLDQFVHNSVYSLDQDGIDIAVNDFQSCINEAANIALKQRKVKITGKKKKDKPWYNTLLHDLKKSLDHYSRVLALNPFNKELRAKCFHLSKTYNKTRKEKRRNYFKDLMVKLKNTSQSNPKAFWDIINTLKSSDQENKESGIDAESWLHHFKELNTVNNSKLNLNNEYWNALKLCKIPEGHSYLDCNITRSFCHEKRQLRTQNGEPLEDFWKSFKSYLQDNLDDSSEDKRRSISNIETRQAETRQEDQAGIQI